MLQSHVHFVWGGRFTSREPWIHPETTLETTELILVTEGVVCIEEEGTRYELTKDSVLLLRPNRLHRGWRESCERVSFYWLHLENFALDEQLPSSHFTLREPQRACMLCRQLLYYQTGGFGADVCDRLAYVLLAELADQCAGTESDGALASRIREWVRINSDRRITAADTARRFGYNEDYISRLTKQCYGITLKAMIDRMRTEHVKYLLTESDLTLAEIADRSGFSDYKLFLKFFRYHEGTTPSEFRRIFSAIHTNNR